MWRLVQKGSSLVLNGKRGAESFSKMLFLPLLLGRWDVLMEDPLPILSLKNLKEMYFCLLMIVFLSILSVKHFQKLFLHVFLLVLLLIHV